MNVHSIEEKKGPRALEIYLHTNAAHKIFYNNYIPIYPKFCSLSRQYVRRGLIDSLIVNQKKNRKGLVMGEAVLPSSPLVLPDPNERGGGHTQHTHTLRVQSRSEVTDDRTGTPSGTHTAAQRWLAI